MAATAVESGAEALDDSSAAARGGRPFALVLLDVNMPMMDGFSVAEAVGSEPRAFGHRSIMMLSSSGTRAMPIAAALLASRLI